MCVAKQCLWTILEELQLAQLSLKCLNHVFFMRHFGRCHHIRMILPEDLVASSLITQLFTAAGQVGSHSAKLTIRFFA